MSAPKQFMCLESTFEFGKYRDKDITLEQAIEDDLPYVKWLIRENMIEADDEALESIEAKR